MLTKEQAKQQRKWFKVDASGVILGKLAVVVADLLCGKGKVNFTPNVDNGDYVIVVNAEKVLLSGKKEEKTFWYRHSGYIGGIKRRSGQEMISKYSDQLVYRAIKGMIAKNRLSRKILRKLFVYKDANHAHNAQQPTLYRFGDD